MRVSIDLARPDGQYVAGADKKGHLFLWEVSTGKEKFKVAAHVIPDAKPNDRRYSNVAFSADGKQLATACEDDGEVKLWNAENGQLLRSLGRGEGFANITVRPNGAWLAATGRNISARTPDLSVRIWDLKTGQVRHVLLGHTGPVVAFAFSPDETQLATTSKDTTSKVWDLKTGKENGTYRGHKLGAHAVTFTPDGKRVVALGGDRVIKTWDATRGPEALKLATRSSYLGAFSPDGRHVAVAAAHVTKKEHLAIIWDTATGAELNAFGDKFEMPRQVAYSPDGKYLAAAIDADNDGWVRVWDVTAGKLHGRFPDQKQGEIAPCFTVAYSPDGKLLAAGGADRLVHVWDTATGTKKFTLTGHVRSLSGTAFSRDSRRLASASGGITWNINLGGKNLLKLKSDNEKGPIVCHSSSPQNQRNSPTFELREIGSPTNGEKCGVEARYDLRIQERGREVKCRRSPLPNSRGNQDRLFGCQFGHTPPKMRPKWLDSSPCQASRRANHRQ